MPGRAASAKDYCSLLQLAHSPLRNRRTLSNSRNRQKFFWFFFFKKRTAYLPCV
jgi:hypothetical protein